jgi:hypothetical protein
LTRGTRVVVVAGVCGGGKLVASQITLRGVFNVRRTMTQAQVLATAGRPRRKISIVFRGRHEVCWMYRARKPNTSVDAIDFCFERGRVARILLGVHG